MTGWWRSIYYALGWEYPESWDKRQRHLKFEMLKQIKNSRLMLRKVKPYSYIVPDQFIHNKVSKKKVRISEEAIQISPPPPSPESNPYATIKQAEHLDTIEELKTLFKKERKKTLHKQKRFGRRYAVRVSKVHKE